MNTCMLICRKRIVCAPDGQTKHQCAYVYMHTNTPFPKKRQKKRKNGSTKKLYLTVRFEKCSTQTRNYPSLNPITNTSD